MNTRSIPSTAAGYASTSHARRARKPHQWRHGEDVERVARDLPFVWLTYAQAARYTGWSVGHLRNLVSAGEIPVYGRPRVRRFRRDVLDQFLDDPDAAMRAFRMERKARHGD